VVVGLSRWSRSYMCVVLFVGVFSCSDFSPVFY
jgi:hypothetical protein